MVEWITPGRADIIWIDFDPQRGKEMMKRRPALVISLREYNALSGLCIVCPITSRTKNYAQEVKITLLDKPCVVLSDQVKSFDWRVRKASFIATAPDALVDEVVEYVAALIAMP